MGGSRGASRVGGIQKGDGGKKLWRVSVEGLPLDLFKPQDSRSGCSAHSIGLEGCCEQRMGQVQSGDERHFQGRDRSGAHRAALLQSWDLPGLRTYFREGVGRAQPRAGF